MKDNFDIHKWNLERYLNESQEHKQTNENQERKQTAVDWLYVRMFENNGRITKEEYEQAKEMGKEQIENAYLEGDKMEGRASLDDAEQYHNETYGK
jgi:hypothetical protein